ncbi:MAG TPA: ATP-binding protein [Jatrophihabitantaceae bacterium]
MTSDVELRVPADATFVAVVRSVTAGLAARCDLTLDEIEDLRLAVDEACALLLPHAGPDTSITARFALRTDYLELSMSVPAEPDATPDRGGFGWTVLCALADEVHVSSGGPELVIAVTKRRASTTTR